VDLEHRSAVRRPGAGPGREAAPLDEAAPGRPPGEIVRAAAFGIDVACAGSLWRLMELQLEGKKRLAAGPFIQGTRLQAGDRLGT
jgi:methionyl-tRNA formyltransferase